MRLDAVRTISDINQPPGGNIMKQDKKTLLSSWLANAGDYVSGEELATLLHTTTRTVRNYIREINAASEGNPLILASRKGYRWNIPEGSMQILPAKKNSLPLTPSERTSYILRQILYRKNIQYDTLLDKLMVSSYTLDGDLLNMKGILRPFQMTLHRRGSLLYLEGKQVDRRRLIVNTILRRRSVSVLTLEYLDTVFSGISATEISYILQKRLPEYALSGSGERYYELVLHIMVQLEQIMEGNIISRREFVLSDLEVYPDYACALDIAKNLEILAGRPYSQPEKEHLALLLIAMDEDNYPIAHAIPPAALNLQGAARAMISQLEIHLHTDFSGDSFSASLSMYLQRMIIRQKLHLSRPSQLRSKMRSAYPTLYKLIANFLFTLSEAAGLSISSDEICWFAIKLASYVQDNCVFEAPVPTCLILPVDHTLAKHIQIQLSERMGDLLDIRQCLLQTDIGRISQDAKLVLSLIPMPRYPHCIQISPFPNSSDFRKIYREILHIKTEEHILRLKEYLSKYLKDSLFIHTSELKTKTSVIHCVCHELIKEGIISSEYEKHLIEAEDFESSGFDDLVAVPFTTHSCIKQNCVFVVTTKEPIPWLSGKINLFFFLICNDPGSFDFLNLYDLLIKVFCQPQNVKKVAGSRTIQEFYAALTEIQENA